MNPTSLAQQLLRQLASHAHVSEIAVWKLGEDLDCRTGRRVT